MSRTQSISRVARLGYNLTCDDSIPLFGDNTTAISIATNLIHHEHTKHIEVDSHYIRGLVHDKVLCLIHVPSRDQVVDLFTKPMTFPRHECDALNPGVR